jgi:hypothetical protein
VQGEVAAALRSPLDFLVGLPALLRRSDRLRRIGVKLRDGRYLSARWSRDARQFAHELATMLAEPRTSGQPTDQLPVLNRSRMLFFSSSVVCCGALSSSPRPVTPAAGPNSS